MVYDELPSNSDVMVPITKLVDVGVEEILELVTEEVERVACGNGWWVNDTVAAGVEVTSRAKGTVLNDCPTYGKGELDSFINVLRSELNSERIPLPLLLVVLSPLPLLLIVSLPLPLQPVLG